MRKTFKTEGIVLKRTNFAEADRIVTVFSKHYGKIVCLAKGIRKMCSRKRGNLEIFNQVILFVVSGKGLDIITETELLNSFSVWRKSLTKIATAYEICEMVDKLTVEGNEQEEVYCLLKESLKQIGNLEQNELSALVNVFGEKLTQLLGFWPRNKPFPENFNAILFVEQIMERELKSKKFLSKVDGTEGIRAERVADTRQKALL